MSGTVLVHSLGARNAKCRRLFAEVYVSKTGGHKPLVDTAEPRRSTTA